MVLGFTRQVLHQLHPFYSLSSDRKKHPHLAFKNQIPHPLQMHVWILQVVISQFSSRPHNKALPGPVGERGMHVMVIPTLPLPWDRCGEKRPTAGGLRGENP